MATVTTPIGKVMITPKGEWSSISPYSRLDLVSYEGSSYLAISDVTAGTAVSNTTYWLCIAHKGDPGASWEEEGITGVVGIVNGGTGATTVAAARENLGLGPVALESTVPVSMGGTGATTAANARTNLGVTPANIGAMVTRPAVIEFQPGSASANNGGYLDFHYNQSTADYTARIIEEASGQIGIKGKVTTNNPITSNPGSGASYIDGCAGGSAGIYVKKGSLNADQWIPGIAIQTKTGGGWAIGNYNNENLQIVYGTKANIDAHNNSTVIMNIDTSGNYSGKAANVTGTVAIANGGTGATTAAGARNALGLGNTTGAVPIANGGTGATTVAAARNALGLGNTSGAVPVANGGTGATTAANARTNLGLTGIAVRPDYSISTTDLTAGTSALTTNAVYFVYS